MNCFYYCLNIFFSSLFVFCWFLVLHRPAALLENQRNCPPTSDVVDSKWLFLYCPLIQNPPKLKCETATAPSLRRGGLSSNDKRDAAIFYMYIYICIYIYTHLSYTHTYIPTRRRNDKKNILRFHWKAVSWHILAETFLPSQKMIPAYRSCKPY